MITSPTSEATILPKAPPITTPTARSTTLPFIANSLNSEARLMTGFLPSAPVRAPAGRQRLADALTRAQTHSRTCLGHAAATFFFLRVRFFGALAGTALLGAALVFASAVDFAFVFAFAR